MIIRQFNDSRSVFDIQFYRSPSTNTRQICLTSYNKPNSIPAGQKQINSSFNTTTIVYHSCHCFPGSERWQQMDICFTLLPILFLLQRKPSRFTEYYQSTLILISFVFIFIIYPLSKRNKRMSKKAISRKINAQNNDWLVQQ